MNDLEDRISQSLAAHAGGEVDAAALAASAAARGRVRLRRRRTAIACAAVLTVGALAAAPARLPGGGPGGGYVGELAAVPAEPGAIERPDLVGTDPNLLHFAVDPAVGRLVYWESVTGRESVQVTVDKQYIAVDVGPDAGTLDETLHDAIPVGTPRRWTDGMLDGRPTRSGTLAGGGRVLRWSPTDGLWVRIAGYVPADTLHTVAEGLWLEEVRRCTVPFQLTALPPGARVTGCTVNARSWPDGVDAAVLVGGGERTMQVQIQHHPRYEGSGKDGNHRVAGREAFLYPAHDELELLDVGASYLSARIGKAYAGFTVADAELVLAGLRLADPLDRDSWPSLLATG